MYERLGFITAWVINTVCKREPVCLKDTHAMIAVCKIVNSGASKPGFTEEYIKYLLGTGDNLKLAPKARACQNRE